jgi:hypothetical protein
VGTLSEGFQSIGQGPKIEDIGHLALLNVNTIMGPFVVIPDLDNKNTRAYLRLMPRHLWGEMFDEWLEMEHTKVSYPAT